LVPRTKESLAAAASPKPVLCTRRPLKIAAFCRSATQPLARGAWSPASRPGAPDVEAGSGESHTECCAAQTAGTPPGIVAEASSLGAEVPMTVLRSLLLLAFIGAASVPSMSAPVLPSFGPTQRLAIMQCCGCVERSDAETHCDKYNCPDCPVPHLARG